MMKKALITGITGQDGAYLAKLLLEKGYRVRGILRSDNCVPPAGLRYLGLDRDIELISMSFEDTEIVQKLIKDFRPDEVYNLAAQSSVSCSFQEPELTLRFNINSVLNLLQAIRLQAPDTKLFQPSSSDMFGSHASLPVNLETPFAPVSPYAVSKLAGHEMVKNYRNIYNIYAVIGIMFNHESYLREPTFFVKKVLRQSIEISKGLRGFLEVGNIEIKRDFGYAPAYVEAMWLAMQQEHAENYMICSGRSVQLKDVILHLFQRLKISEERLVISHKLYRPEDIPDMYGDNSKARLELGWRYDADFMDVLDILLEEELRNWR